MSAAAADPPGGAIDVGPTIPGEDLMDGARRMRDDRTSLGSTASRASALLARAALEEALWTLSTSFRTLSGRALLLLVPRLIGRRTGRRAALAWNELSAASHHDAYESPLTLVELDRLLDEVTAIRAEVRRYHAARSGR